MSAARGVALVAAIGILVLVGLAGVLYHRMNTPGKDATGQDTSVTRPVLAVLRVGIAVLLAASS